MASRIQYTATVTVPIYAGWKCEHCGEVNFTAGTMACSKTAGAIITTRNNTERTRERAIHDVQTTWADEVCTAFRNPNSCGDALYDNLHMQNTCCSACGKPARWSQHTPWSALVRWLQDKLPLRIIAVALIIAVLICFFLKLLSFVVAIGLLILLGGLVFAVWNAVRKRVYKNVLYNLPKEYTPVFGSLNAELAVYAKTINMKIPTPDQCRDTVAKYSQPKPPSA